MRHAQSPAPPRSRLLAPDAPGYVRAIEPISAACRAGLLPPLYAGLEALLRGLDAGDGERPTVAVAITLDPDSAWRLLYHALPAAEARARATVEGEVSLAASLFATRSDMV